MTQSIKWGFYGSGIVAQDVAADFSQVSGAAIAAVASRTQKSAQQFAKRFNVPKVYESLEQMLEDSALDVIYIATPHHLHQQHSLSCLQAGKAIVCEKPFTVSAAEAKVVIKAARQRNLFCMEAMWMRFFPLVQAAKKRIADNELGDIQLIRADFGYPTPFNPDGRFFNTKLAGGALLDRGIYPISLTQYLLGNPETIASEAYIGATGVDEHSSCTLQYQSGAIASLSSTLRELGTNEAVITGSKNTLKIHDPFYRPSSVSLRPTKTGAVAKQLAQSSLIQTTKNNPAVQSFRKIAAPIKRMIRGKTTTTSFPGNGYQFEIQEATRCLQQGLIESPIMPLEDTLSVLKIMDTMREQWENKTQ